MVTVGIADLNVARNSDTVCTYALGSCVGICLYDKDLKIAGLAHIMLPWSKDANIPNDNMRRYADTGITELIQKMIACGARKPVLTAKIAGGAQMFATNSAVFNIGDRNVDAVKKVLASYNIPIIAEQTGSNFGRTVFFHADTGIMEIRAATKPTVML
ncbi:MAG: chemotaxis protein CheD [Oscillospiraceae bacterium]|nr:chemotaxis protein CheD [Oscillospiraceae bacterium]